MNAESLRNELLRKVISISQRIYKLRRCLLVSETDCDKFALDIREISRLEGIQEGIKLSISTIQKHIGRHQSGTRSGRGSRKEGDE